MFLMNRIITENKRQQSELNKQKITERELTNLNQKINKLLGKLEEHEQETANSIEEECVVCITSKATISTYPCGHCVTCRQCFVKTIQNAVIQKNLPLRCVICRAKILRLKQTFNSNLLAETSRSKSKYKRQTRAYGSQSIYQHSYQYTKGNYSKNSSNVLSGSKKRSPEPSSISSKSSCLKKIAQQQTTINQINNVNAIENKIDLEKLQKEDKNDLDNEASGKALNEEESMKLKNELQLINRNDLNNEEIKLEENVKSIQAKQKAKSLKARVFDCFTARANVNDIKYEINYSSFKKFKSNWSSRFKKFKNEFKVLFNF